MGSPVDEPGRIDDEVRHRVQLTRDFQLGRTEVTWSLWKEVREWAVANGYSDIAKGNNGYLGGDEGLHPVTAVTWWDAIQWCNARSEKEGLQPVYHGSSDFTSQSVVRSGLTKVHVNWDADGYRLPTEAEWEFACRAGTSTAFNSGAITHGGQECESDPNADAAGWHCSNSERNTHPAAGKAANAWGFHDMHGNVWEWCWDWYAPYPQNDEDRDPVGPAEGTARIMRGGAWMNAPRDLRSAHRHALSPATPFYSIGFRVARTNAP